MKTTMIVAVLLSAAFVSGQAPFQRDKSMAIVMKPIMQIFGTGQALAIDEFYGSERTVRTIRSDKTDRGERAFRTDRTQRPMREYEVKNVPADEPGRKASIKKPRTFSVDER